MSESTHCMQTERMNTFTFNRRSNRLGKYTIEHCWCVGENPQQRFGTFPATAMKLPSIHNHRAPDTGPLFRISKPQSSHTHIQSTLRAQVNIKTAPQPFRVHTTSICFSTIVSVRVILVDSFVHIAIVVFNLAVGTLCTYE